MQTQYLLCSDLMDADKGLAAAVQGLLRAKIFCEFNPPVSACPSSCPTSARSPGFVPHAHSVFAILCEDVSSFPLRSSAQLPYVSIRQHTSAYVSIRQHTSAYVSIRQHTSDLRVHRLHLPQLLRCQYLYFCTSTASQLSTSACSGVR
jgi:hypothetical protein